MRIIIRIIFIIFIANGINCLGSICDDCCDCLKGKNKNKGINGKVEVIVELNKKAVVIERMENIVQEGEKKENEGTNSGAINEKKNEGKEINNDKNIIVGSLVSETWYKTKEELVLKVLKKKDSNIFSFKDNESEVLIELPEKDSSKIEYVKKTKEKIEKEDKLKLNNEKWTFFKIKDKYGEEIYLYCSDIESFGGTDYFSPYGIFSYMDHQSISVIACDTTNVENMQNMFYYCSSLTDLNIRSFNTTNVEKMDNMFYKCSSLKELDLSNFNTTNVENMKNMFSYCSSLTELDLSNFNTTNVWSMENMFSYCSSLTELDLTSFNTTKVSNMERMFYSCISLTILKLGKDFIVVECKKKTDMFTNCDKLNSFLKLRLGCKINNI